MPGGDAELKKALAVLISSTRSKKRTLPLTEISKWVDIAVARLGSFEAVAERLGLSTKMLRQFSYVSRLTGSVQQMFQERLLDSVDAATHLAILPESDQALVAHHVVQGDINTIDLRAVVQLRKLNAQQPIEELIKTVKQSKTQRHYVLEFVARETRDQKKIVALLLPYLPKPEIVKIDLQGAFGRLVVTAEGKRYLTALAKRLKIPIKQVLPRILSQRV